MKSILINKKLIKISLFIFLLYLLVVYIHQSDFNESWRERRLRSVLLDLSETLDLKNSAKNNITDVIKDAENEGKKIQYQPNSKNPFPEFLPTEYVYFFYDEKNKTKDGVLIRSEFNYFLKNDSSTCLYWDGTITGSPTRGSLNVK